MQLKAGYFRFFICRLSGIMIPLAEKLTAYSIAFSNSRIFPGIVGKANYHTCGKLWKFLAKFVSVMWTVAKVRKIIAKLRIVEYIGGQLPYF